MSRFVRCDTCRKEVNTSAELSESDDPWPSVFLPAEPGTAEFCSWRCMADFAVAKSLIDSAGES